MPCSVREVDEILETWPLEMPHARVWVGLRVDLLDPVEMSRVEHRLEREGVAGVALFSHNLLVGGRGRR